MRNQKYEITDIAHEQYPFLHRIRALRDIGEKVKAGELGGFVESESNLSFEPGDDAWIFGDAIACGGSYVDKGSRLFGDVVVCGNAYISQGSALSGHARAEDDAYIRGADLCGHARVSGSSMILNLPDMKSAPILSGNCVVYGKVMGDVHLSGNAVVLGSEEIRNDTPDTLLINERGRTVRRDPSRDELAPRAPRAQGTEERKKHKRKDVIR